MKTHNLRKSLRINNVDQVTYLNPLISIAESLRVNVRTHAVRGLIQKMHSRVLKPLVQPCNRYAMSASDIAHGRVATRTDNVYHRLVVLMHSQLNLFRKKCLPQAQKRQSAKSHRRVSRDDLCLRRGVRHAPLTLTNSSDRKTTAGSAHGKVVT